ncbi:UTP--glucose-1-phosphate uridylyltransferase [Yoonia vestfoldensis]|uniref:UTP--glucose-1-phosphate uridylyltransferase n=1 Tax=Yoonia vestfoldensis TaxID=245188 RepID=UPI0003A31A56|nr:UTP--glucose-1-phosphate uridylyltransferase [Yoonia vestfoldensis]
MSKGPVRTAIFPVAGLGTRFLPATKATPKELLPVLDTPLIQFAIDEARDAGVERMVFVSHPSKSAIERYVMDDAELRATLRDRGKAKLARDLHKAAIDEDDHEVTFVMQHDPLGLGHAVLCARDAVLPGPVAVILPDDLIVGQKGCLSEMIAAYQDIAAGHLVATINVPRQEVSKYGILSVVGQTGPFTKADGMVEKPDPKDTPSTTAVVGRYVLDPCIFDALARQTPGAGGEVQLTDAIAKDILTTGLAGFQFSGQRFDCGTKQGMLSAMLHLARHDPAFDDVLGVFLNQNPTPNAA